MPEPTALLLFTGVGALTGLLGSLLGIGGGVLLVPLLTLALGVPIRVAVAASLISVIATASASATVNLGRGLVNVRLGLALELATSVGGLAGGVAASLLTARHLFQLFAATLTAMGVLVLLRSGRRNVSADPALDVGRLGGWLHEAGRVYGYRLRRLPAAFAASLAAGAVSGLLGIGGGIIKVPVLNTFCGVPIRVAAGTSTFMIGVTAATSAVIYWARGDVALPLTAAVALGSLPASLLGARLSDRLPAPLLKRLLAALLLAVGARMWIGTL
jgi:uncharacterized membrane protein YfcA